MYFSVYILRRRRIVSLFWMQKGSPKFLSVTQCTSQGQKQNTLEFIFKMTSNLLGNETKMQAFEKDITLLCPSVCSNALYRFVLLCFVQLTVRSSGRGQTE